MTASLDEHRQARIDLAAAFRWFARLDMHESIANHMSVAVSEDGSRFLINPCRLHFSRVTASSLLLLDAHDPTTLDRPDAPDPTAWYLPPGCMRGCRRPAASCICTRNTRHPWPAWRTARCRRST